MTLPNLSSIDLPTRSLRNAAIARWVLLAAVTLMAVYSLTSWYLAYRAGLSAQGPERYYCAMHPQIRSPNPGDCPICQMSLSPLPQERQSRSNAERTATGHSRLPLLQEVTTVTLTAEQQQAIGLAVHRVTTQTLTPELSVAGVVNVVPSRMARVQVRSSAMIDRVLVDRGQRVRRNEPLGFAIALQNTTQSHNHLPSQPASSPLAAGPNAASLSPRGALPLLAPIDGIILEHNAVVGSYAEPATVLFVIAELSTVVIEATLAADELAKVSSTTAAHWALDSSDRGPARQWPSVAQRGPGQQSDSTQMLTIDPALDARTGAGSVQFVVANDDGQLRPGARGVARFALRAVTALFAPQDAVIDLGEQPYVYVLGPEDTFEPRAVRVGVRVGEQLEIREGLAEGAQVVSRASFMLDSESRLRASLNRSANAAQSSPVTDPSREATERAAAEASRSQRDR